jgi:glc operon protein GlcG
MKLLSSMVVASILTVVAATVPAGAQAPSAPPPYGAPIGLEAAKKLATAAEAEATKNNWNMAIVILDGTGHVVLLRRLDNTQYGSIAVAALGYAPRYSWRTSYDVRRLPT